MKLTEKLLSFLLCACVLTEAGYFVLKKTGVVSAAASGSADGVYYTQSEFYRESGSLSVKISSRQAVLLVNGEPADTETEGDYLGIIVYDGDVIDIDLRGCGDDEVSLFVAEISDNVSYPQQGTKLFSQRGIKHLFNVRVDNN